MGFIKKLFGGILGFLQGLFGGKKSEGSAVKPAKSNGYFLEFDDSANGKSPEAKPASKPAEPAKEPVAVGAPAKAAPEPAAEPAKAEKTESAPASKKTSIKAKKAQSSSANAQPAEVKQPEAQPQPVAAATKTKVSKIETPSTFAPTYVSPTVVSSSRRRPGPSMNPFMEMARQVKTPKARA
ncbi:MAG: hypothetical protein F6K32_14480 [Desertifilum sp. SIO1I2]|nr:hypothetical protein [Desertifilum sp. SIO1I2]